MKTKDLKTDGHYWWRPNNSAPWAIAKVCSYQEDQKTIYPESGSGLIEYHFTRTYPNAEFEGPIPPPKP